MSVRMMALVFERYPNGGSEMLFALALADHAHDDGTHIYPGIPALMRKTRQSERSVQNQLRKMLSSGFLQVVSTSSGGPGNYSEYKINPDWINGAKVAPLETVQSDTETVQSGTANGANSGIAYKEEPNTKQIQPKHSARDLAGSKPPGKVPSENQNAKTILLGFGIPASLCDSFVRVRNKKQLAVTPEAVRGVEREAVKLGLTLVQAITICCEKGWAGFNSKWQEAVEAAAELLGKPIGNATAEPAKALPSGGSWMSSPEGVVKRGKELGLNPNPGESQRDFHARVLSADKNARQSKASKVFGEFRQKSGTAQTQPQAP